MFFTPNLECRVAMGSMSFAHLTLLSVLFPLRTWCDNKVRELIAIKVLHTSLLNVTGRLESTPLGKLCIDTSA
jgi:hypothetical protein